MKHHWQCKICGKAGAVKCWLFSDLEKILKKVEQNHKKVSPDCSCPVNKLSISSE